MVMYYWHGGLEVLHFYRKLRKCVELRPQSEICKVKAVIYRGQ